MQKLPPTAPIPPQLLAAHPVFIARTDAELSCIAPVELLPSPTHFRLIQIAQTFGTTESGILKQLLDPLAAADIWVLALGTHDTDYLLLRADQTDTAIRALTAAGHHLT